MCHGMVKSGCLEQDLAPCSSAYSVHVRKVGQNEGQTAITSTDDVSARMSKYFATHRRALKETFPY